MKNRFESLEVFEAYARIEASYFILQKLMAKLENRSSIDKVIDIETGYEKSIYEEMMSIITDMIKDKEFVEYPDIEEDKLRVKELRKQYELAYGTDKQ